MLLQPSLHHHNASLTFSSLSYSLPLPCRSIVPNLKLPKTANYRGVPITVTCSISQIHSYGTMDYERRPIVKWNAIYKRISMMENPELGSGTVLDQWEKQGRRLSKWELCRVVKELRKYKRFKRALEVKKNKEYFWVPFDVFVLFWLMGMCYFWQKYQALFGSLA